jgi:hypothetical protein
MKMRSPNTPNIPKPSPTSGLNQNGFDSLANEDEYIKERKKTAPLTPSIGHIFAGFKNTNGK